MGSKLHLVVPHYYINNYTCRRKKPGGGKILLIINEHNDLGNLWLCPEYLCCLLNLHIQKNMALFFLRV
jgi:hypothetical protein